MAIVVRVSSTAPKLPAPDVPTPYRVRRWPHPESVWGILENGAGNADALALSAGKLAATVADIGIVTFLGVHNEIVGIGYLGSFHNLLHGGILYAESNVIEESVIKENGFLIDVSYQAAQIGDTRILDIKTVYQDLPDCTSW